MGFLDPKPVTTAGLDAATAALAANPASDLAGELSATYGTPATAIVMATPAKFPAIDNTGATATQVGLQQAIDAAPAGGRVVFQGIYNLTGTVIIPPANALTLDFSAATIIRAGSAMGFKCEQPFDAQYAISAIVSEAITIDGEAATVTKLTMTAAPNWAVNDTIKVVSDDVIPGGHVTSATVKPRLGELSEVHSIAGTTVYLKALLRDTYTTAPRAARLPYGTVHVDGGTADVTDTVVTNKTDGTLFRFQNLHAPSVRNLHARRLVGMGLSFKSCLGYYVENYNVDWAMNNPTDGVYGYGIHDSSCQGGIVNGGVQRNLRHPFTDGTADVAAGSTDTSSFGRSQDFTLIGVKSIGCTAAGFDTHHNGRGGSFIGCKAVVPPEVNGFLLRGEGHSVIDCEVEGGLSALQVMTQVTGTWSEGESRRHNVDNLKVTGSIRVMTVALRMATTHPNYNVRDTESTVIVNGVNARDVQRIGVIVNGTVKLRNINFVGDTLADGAILQVENSFVDVDASVDLNPVTSVGGGTQRLIYVDPIAAEASDVRIRRFDVKASSTYRTAAATPIVAAATTQRFISENILFETPWAAADPFSIPAAVPQSIRWSCLWDPADTLTQRSSASLTLSNSALAGSIAALTRGPDPQLVLTANITDSTPRTMIALPLGQFDGQRLTVVLGSATAGLTIPNGASYTTRLSGGVDKTLTVGNQSVTLLWSAGAWRESLDSRVLAKSTADTVVNNTTTQAAVTGISLAVAASAVYEIEGALIYAAATAADIAFGWTYPASATMDWCANGLSTGTTSPTSSIARQPKLISETSPIGGAGVASKIFAYPKGLLVTGGTAGTVQLTVAQLAADPTDATVFAGSYLKLTRIL
jgi:hypothetical protein